MTPAPHPARPARADDPYQRTVDQQQREIDKLGLRVAVLENVNYRLHCQNQRLKARSRPSKPRWWETCIACLATWTDAIYAPEGYE